MTAAHNPDCGSLHFHTEDIHLSAEFLFTSTRPKTTFRTCVYRISDNTALNVDYAASNE